MLLIYEIILLQFNHYSPKPFNYEKNSYENDGYLLYAWFHAKRY